MYTLNESKFERILNQLKTVLAYNEINKRTQSNIELEYDANDIACFEHEYLYPSYCISVYEKKEKHSSRHY